MYMDELTFYILDIENHGNALTYHDRFGNSLISNERGEFYFDCRFHGRYRIKYTFSTVNLDRELVKTMVRIFNKSLQEAEEISKENMGKEMREGDLLSNITSIINKYSYYSEHDNKDFFDLITEIFIRILMGHFLENGNKRLALTMLKAILWHFGYYLKFTKGMMWKNYSNHKTKVEGFVQSLENKNNNDVSKAFFEVKEWIQENVIIGINWRRGNDG